jgi:hypothetical protein
MWRSCKTQTGQSAVAKSQLDALLRHSARHCPDGLIRNWARALLRGEHVSSDDIARRRRQQQAKKQKRSA